MEFLDLKRYPALRKSALEQAFLDKLQEFLLESGRGFCFVARQKLMRYEDEDFILCSERCSASFRLTVSSHADVCGGIAA